MKMMSPPFINALIDIGQKISTIRNPEELLNSILDIAIQHLSAERGFILLKDEKKPEQFYPKVARNINPAQISQIQDISQSTVKKVLESCKPILTFDALADERFDDSQSVFMQKIRSIACVPLIYQGELLGVIYIDRRGQTAGLTNESLEFLQAFANQAAIALENVRLLTKLQEENTRLKEEFHRIYAFKEIVGHSPAMESVFQTIGKVLNNDTIVLIMGETGTGKELVARAIHYNGWRKEKPFIPINCGAIPENLVESELFGHKKGAFTGAIFDKKGLVEETNGGTLFLDEIAELPLPVQIKLLRFLQDKIFTPIGDTSTRQVDVRIITATNKNLLTLCRAGKFREDLFYRLNVITINMPPLRDRLSDIPLLVKFFIEKYNSKLNKKIESITKGAMKKLMEYSWPGNVRELENTIERALVLSSGPAITEENLILTSEEKEETIIRAGLKLKDLSKTLLQKSLEAAAGNKTKAAELMGVSLRWVHYKMKDWDLS